MSNLWPDGGGGGFGRDGGPGGGLVAARKGRSPGQGDQGFLRRNFQKKQLSEIGSLSLR
jgi:hypothetical protein